MVVVVVRVPPLGVVHRLRSVALRTICEKATNCSGVSGAWMLTCQFQFNTKSGRFRTLTLDSAVWDINAMLPHCR